MKKRTVFTKKRKFSKDVARFFNPEKSEYCKGNKGTHQDEKRKERSYIPVVTVRPSMRRFNRSSC